MACEDFKKTKSAAKMAEKAKKIYEEFIQTEAPKEVGPGGRWVSVVCEAPSAMSWEGVTPRKRSAARGHSDGAWPPFLSTYWVQGPSSVAKQLGLILPGRTGSVASLSSSSNDTRVWS